MPNLSKTRSILIGLLVLIAASAAPVTKSLAPGGYLAGTELGHLVSLVVDLNSIRVEALDGLDASKLDVYWSDLTESQSKGIRREPRSTRVFHAGKPDQPIPKEYGTNNFNLVYDGVSILKDWDQFKFGNWHYHSYNIKLYRSNTGQVVATLTATGQDQSWGPNAPK
jgi:hypothetical protein